MGNLNQKDEVEHKKHQVKEKLFARKLNSVLGCFESSSAKRNGQCFVSAAHNVITLNRLERFCMISYALEKE